MLSKKYYQSIAKCIKEHSALCEKEEIVLKANLSYCLCQFFISDNPKFDIEKWLKTIR